MVWLRGAIAPILSELSYPLAFKNLIVLLALKHSCQADKAWNENTASWFVYSPKSGAVLLRPDPMKWRTIAPVTGAVVVRRDSCIIGI